MNEWTFPKIWRALFLAAQHFRGFESWRCDSVLTGSRLQQRLPRMRQRILDLDSSYMTTPQLTRSGMLMKWSPSSVPAHWLNSEKSINSLTTCTTLDLTPGAVLLPSQDHGIRISERIQWFWKLGNYSIGIFSSTMTRMQLCPLALTVAL